MKESELEASEPEASEPTGAEQEATEPTAAEQEATEPTAAEQEATEPTVAGQEATEPTAAEQEASEPTAAEQEATEPTAAEQEATEPTAAEQEASEPTVAEQEATEPTAAEQEASEPTVAEQEATEPTAAEQEATEPTAAEQGATEPTIAEQEASEPMAAEQEASEPAAAEQEATEPTVAEQEATEPTGAEQEATEPTAAEQEATEPTAAEQEASEPTAAGQEATEPTVAEQEATEPTGAEPAAAKLDIQILAFGETLWDMLPRGAVLGGAPFNFCYRAIELGAQTAIITCVGDDELGANAAAALKKLGLNAPQVDPKLPTGTVGVYFDKSNEPHYVIRDNVAYEAIARSTEATQLAATADCLCFGSLAQRTRMSRLALEQSLNHFSGRYRVYDLNLRPNRYTAEIVRRSLERCDIVKLNIEEAKFLHAILPSRATDIPGLLAELQGRYNLRAAVATLGSKGSCVVGPAGETILSSGYHSEIVDTIGAGDAFTAAFVISLLKGDDIQAASEFANAYGAAVVSQEGATRTVTPDMIEKIIASESPRVIATESDLQLAGVDT